MESKTIVKEFSENILGFTSQVKKDEQTRKVLELRAFELLHKFRKTWNEAEYQEWCTIQRFLHKIY